MNQTIKQYHILVTGFEIDKTNSYNMDKNKTSLRHYRKDINLYDYKYTDHGTYEFYNSSTNTLDSIFPIERTMILIEDKKSDKIDE